MARRCRGAGAVHPINARLRDELLDGEIFYTLREAQIVIESWRRHYNAVRPHASIGYRAPAEVFVLALRMAGYTSATVENTTTTLVVLIDVLPI